MAALSQIPELPPADPVLSAPVSPNTHKIKVGGKYDVTKIGHRGIGGGLDFYSIERERAMGKQLAQQVEQTARLFTDPVVNEYVNRIGQNLVRHSDAKVPFTIKIIDDDQVNAFALPGGYFFVNTGLILAADNEAELAGVMAHEIGHVAARHATKTETRQQLFNLATIPLIFFGGPAGLIVREAMGVAVPMSFLKFSRDEEREADLLGIEYEYSAGYDPAEFVHFFETLNSREKGAKKGKFTFIAKAFATHPMNGDRIKRAEHEIDTMLPPKREYIVDTSEFEAIKARLRRIENQQQIGAGSTELPTLRRREPEHNTTEDNKKDQEDQNRPVLTRRTN
jgi:predicted Zn-dependent protease